MLRSEAKDTSEARYLRADRPADPFAVFLPREKGHKYSIDHRDGLFYIQTNKGAVRAKKVVQQQGLLGG